MHTCMYMYLCLYVCFGSRRLMKQLSLLSHVVFAQHLFVTVDYFKSWHRRWLPSATAGDYFLPPQVTTSQKWHRRWLLLWHRRWLPRHRRWQHPRSCVQPQQRRIPKQTDTTRKDKHEQKAYHKEDTSKRQKQQTRCSVQDSRRISSQRSWRNICTVIRTRTLHIVCYIQDSFQQCVRIQRGAAMTRRRRLQYLHIYIYIYIL